MKDKIQSAYHASKNVYDSVLTQGNLFGKLYMKLFWSGTDDNAIAKEILSDIPDAFDGVLLDVPVGTAVFTYRKWAGLSGKKGWFSPPFLSKKEVEEKLNQKYQAADLKRMVRWCISNVSNNDVFLPLKCFY